jgi:hypothetical protein
MRIENRKQTREELKNYNSHPERLPDTENGDAFSLRSFSSLRTAITHPSGFSLNRLGMFRFSFASSSSFTFSLRSREDFISFINFEFSCFHQSRSRSREGGIRREDKSLWLWLLTLSSCVSGFSWLLNELIVCTAKQESISSK